jgi:hypothetical protein
MAEASPSDRSKLDGFCEVLMSGSLPSQDSLYDLPRYKIPGIDASSALVAFLGGGYPKFEGFKWLLSRHDFMSLDEWVEVLAFLLRWSGAYVGATTGPDSEIFDPRIEALFDLLTNEAQDPDSATRLTTAIQLYLDQHSSTVLHSLFNGYAGLAKKNDWAIRLLEWGADPFAMSVRGQTPFHLVLSGCHLELFERLHTAVPPDFNFGGATTEVGKNRFFLMRFLWLHRNEKDPETLDVIKTIASWLVNHPSFAALSLGSKVDDDGLNLADYLLLYGWTDYLELDTSTWSSPTGRLPIHSRGPWAPIYSRHSDHPVVAWCYERRYMHVFSPDQRDSLTALVGLHGLPDRYSHAGPDGHMIETFDSQCDKWGYTYSPLAGLLGCE